MENRKYDLEDRLLEFSVCIIDLVEELPNSLTGRHIAGQLLRSGTSPYPNHGEAQAAESPRDFIHKLKVSLKELRESKRWLRLIQKKILVSSVKNLQMTLQENEELVRIFVSSIKTAQENIKYKEK